MPRPRGDSPVKWSDRIGQYVLYFGRKRHLLGTNKVQAERKRLALLAGEEAAPLPLTPLSSLTVGEAVRLYVPTIAGMDSRTVNRVTAAMEALAPFASMPAAEFRGRSLRQVREILISRRKSNGDLISRRYVNHLVQAIQAAFAWLVAEEYVPADVLVSLRAVKALRAGQGGRELPRILPVADAVLEATMPHCGPTVAAMIQLQRLTGCRPGEAIALKASEVKQTESVWWWTPGRHKNAHRGKVRAIPIGPKGQELLRPFLERDREYAFSPADDCKNLPKNRMIRPGEVYTIPAYENAIKRAVRRARRARAKAEGVLLLSRLLPLWSPNQIRHTTATEIRRQFGREAAAEYLGHAGLAVIDVYAERSESTAAEIASKVG